VRKPGSLNLDQVGKKNLENAELGQRGDMAQKNLKLV